MNKIKITIYFFITTLLFTACYDVRIKEHKDWKHFFDEAGVEGCFEYFDNNKEVAHYYNLDFCAERFIPGNTFYALLSVIALDNGLAPDELYTLSWKENLDNTEQEHSFSMTDAFKTSNTSYFRILAEKLGIENIKQSLDTVKYGNNLMDSSNHFWQNGSLLISPDEQVGFIKKLYHSELPYSERAQRIVKNMMIQEKDEFYALHYTTAQVQADSKPFFWIIGYVEKTNVLKHIETKEDQYIPHPYFFSLAIKGNDANTNIETIGKNILNQILKENNLNNK